MERFRPGGPSARQARALLVLALLFAALAPARSRAHDDDLGAAASGPARGVLEGTWRLVSPPLDGGREQFKTIAGGRFIWYVVAHDRVVSSAGGRMSWHDGAYVERIDYSGTEEMDWLVGGSGHFTADLRGDRWRHRGAVTAADGARSAPVDEEWERVR